MTDTTKQVLLTSGVAVRIDAGDMLVFVAPVHQGAVGRWSLVAEVGAPAILLGADIADAQLVATPGDQAEFVQLAASEVDPDALKSSHQLHQAALQVLAQAAQRQRDRVQAELLAEQHDAWLVQDALTDLADAVPGHIELTGTDEAATDIAVMTQLARVLGLPTDPVRLRRAVTDARVSGRDRIAALTEACDASARQVELTTDWWKTAGPPLLVTLPDGRHAMAQWSKGGYRLWTKETGYQAKIQAKDAAQLGVTAKVLQPLLDPSKSASLRDLLRMSFRGAGSSVLVVVVMTVVVGLLNAVVPIVSGKITTSVAEGADTPLLAVAVALVLLVVAVLMLNAVRLFALVRIRTSSTAIASAAVWDRQLRLPMSWHKQRTEVARLTSSMSVDLSSGQAPNTAIIALLDAAAIGGSVLGGLFVSAPVALAIVLFLVLRAAIDARLMRTLVGLTGEAVDQRAQDPTTELLRGVMLLRSAGALARGYARWARFQAQATQLRVRLGRISTVQSMLGVVWPTLGLALVLAVVALTAGDVTQGQTLGVLVAAQTALTSANTALASAIGSVGVLLAAAAVLRRATPILDEIPESAGGGEVAPLAGGIDMRGVAYRYRPDLPPIFRDLNLSVQPGEHLAVVGPSGCGKTTLLRLLLGLDDPETGLVAFDGRDLTGLDRSAVRRQLGVVMQSSSLLPGSIRDNIDLGRGLSASQIWQALAQAAVDADVRGMPMGLNTVVVDGGAGISGGQRQRILLARALAGSPRILLLDEATSALDNVSQRAVTANLESLQITRILVAHRLSTIANADRIAVLSGGKIPAVGTFDELMASSVEFQQLVRRQQIDDGIDVS